MVKYKLVYFDGKSRAEVTRLLFVLAGVEFEDKRITMEEWPEVKKGAIWGTVPYLEVDGEQICQSRSFERFLARKFGLAGKTEMEQVKVDMIMECVEDTMTNQIFLFREKDAEKKAAMIKKMEEEEFPPYMENLEKLLKSNKGGDGYFVGDELTVADLSVAHLLTFPEVVGVDIKLDKYPKLKAHRARVEAIPKIEEWIANRKETPF